MTNFNADILNEQINQELLASHIYMTFYSYFGNSQIAYKGFQSFFKKSSEEEREHAMNLISYINMRGGLVIIKPIDVPSVDYSKVSVLEAFKVALELENLLTARLIDIRKTAESSGDVDTCTFIEDNYIAEQYKSIDEITRLITNIQRCTTDFELMMLDNSLVGK